MQSLRFNFGEKIKHLNYSAHAGGNAPRLGILPSSPHLVSFDISHYGSETVSHSCGANGISGLDCKFSGDTLHKNGIDEIFLTSRKKASR